MHEVSPSGAEAHEASVDVTRVAEHLCMAHGTLTESGAAKLRAGVVVARLKTGDDIPVAAHNNVCKPGQTPTAKKNSRLS